MQGGKCSSVYSFPPVHKIASCHKIYNRGDPRGKMLYTLVGGKLTPDGEVSPPPGSGPPEPPGSNPPCKAAGTLHKDVALWKRLQGLFQALS